MRRLIFPGCCCRGKMQVILLRAISDAMSLHESTQRLFRLTSDSARPNGSSSSVIPAIFLFGSEAPKSQPPGVSQVFPLLLSTYQTLRHGGICRHIYLSLTALLIPHLHRRACSSPTNKTIRFRRHGEFTSGSTEESMKGIPNRRQRLEFFQKLLHVTRNRLSAALPRPPAGFDAR